MRLPATYDVVVTGAGFSGSLMAMVARRLGLSVCLIEKGRHPRFAIGESSTPLANLLWESICEEFDLPHLKPFSKWGTWQDQYPEVGCGLKRGFSFLKLDPGSPDLPRLNREKHLLVAASPNDRSADTHWFRQDFDSFLVQEAQNIGVEYLDGTNVVEARQHGQGITLSLAKGDATFSVFGRFLVDATGLHGEIKQQLGVQTAPGMHLPHTCTLFAHFRNVRRIDADPALHSCPGLPYPVDDAAVHLLLDHGWVWVLRFSNGVTSAGLACTRQFADELNLSSGAPAWTALLQRYPSMQQLFGDAHAITPFHSFQPLSFRASRAVGGAYALLPSAAGFVDPLLSTGFPLTLLGIRRVAKILGRLFERGDATPELREYELTTFRELEVAELLVAALYKTLGDFELFSQLALIYFAAASYNETRMRLTANRTDLSFMLNTHPAFGPEVQRICTRVISSESLPPRARGMLLLEIRAAIEPFDIAGLTNPNAASWFPVNLDDLFRGAGKLGASQAQLRDLVTRCGLN